MNLVERFCPQKSNAAVSSCMYRVSRHFFGDGAANDATGRRGKSDSDQVCSRQSGGFGFLSPGDSGTVASCQRYTASEKPVGGMSSECLREQYSGDVLNKEKLQTAKVERILIQLNYNIAITCFRQSWRLKLNVHCSI